MSIETLTEAILGKMSGVNKWRRNFLGHLFRLFLSMRGRYTFLNAARYGIFDEATYRKHFERPMDWATFNYHLIMHSTAPERFNSFDASYLSKSGKHTPGVGWYWSGCAGKAKWGLEIGAFSVVDVVNHSAMHLVAEQTLAEETQQHGSLLEHYGSLVERHADMLLKISEFLVVDAYFSRKPFVDKVRECQLQLITRLRDDAVLYYPYLGPRHKGRGRHKVFAGRVDTRCLSEEHFSPCACDEQDYTAYEARVWIKSWKRWAKVVVVHQKDEQGKIKTVKVYASTLETMAGADLWLYYKTRFQSEFLFRDAKQHTGLEHCQSRQAEALDFHFNAALTAVSLAKALHWFCRPADQRGPFSMADIKTQYFNELMLDRFFVAYGLNPHQAKNHHAYKSLFELGKIAA
ncbi:MAG: transposase [Saprospiraceae bacterium]